MGSIHNTCTTEAAQRAVPQYAAATSQQVPVVHPRHRHTRGGERRTFMTANSQDRKRIESLCECSSTASSAFAARISLWYRSRTLSCMRRIMTHLRTRSAYASSAAARADPLGLHGDPCSIDCCRTKKHASWCVDAKSRHVAVLSDKSGIVRSHTRYSMTHRRAANVLDSEELPHGTENMARE